MPKLALVLLTLLAAPALAGDFRILIVGDSISDGVVGYPTGPPYTTLLRKRLADLDPTIHLDVAACSGSTSQDWTISEGADHCWWTLARPTLYEAWARPHLPVDLAIVMLGGNDAAPWAAEPRAPRQYRRSMLELVRNLRHDGARRVLWMTSPKLSGYDTTLCPQFAEANQLLGQYRRVARQLTKARWWLERGPDLYKTFPPNGHGIFCDPHPNRYGSVFIAEQLFPFVEEAYYELTWLSHTNGGPRGRQPTADSEQSHRWLPQGAGAR